MPHLTRSPAALLSRYSSFAAAKASETATVAAVHGVRVALYFRRARLIDAFRLRLRSADTFPLPSAAASALEDSFVAVHAIRSAPSPDSALSLFRSLPSYRSSAEATPVLQALAKRLALASRLPNLRAILAAADAGSFPPCLPPTALDRLRWFAAAGDLPAALDLWSSIRSSAASTFKHRRGHPCTESYNIIIGLYAATGFHSAAVATFSQMIQEGAIPNSRTYTIIIEHLVRTGNLAAAAKIFYLLPSMRIPHTSKQHNVLAEGYSSAGNFDELRRLIKEMNSDGILPGRAMREAIAKMREAVGQAEGAEEFVGELLPNECIGYIAESGDEDDSGEEEENDDAVDRIRLKPWLDPIALAKALEDWHPNEVAELEKAKLVWTSRLVCKLLRSFRKAETAWEFFCWVAYQPGGFVHDKHTVSRMISILARDGHVELVERLISKVKVERIRLPFATVRLVVDFYGLSRRADAAIKVFREAYLICDALPASHQLLLCSSLLRTMVKCRRGNDAMELLEEMMLEGVLPDIQTFSGLMQYFASISDLKSVHRLFGIVRQCGLEPDAYMYMVLIQAYCKQERAALALRLFEEMRSSGLTPNAATKTLLVRSLWKEGKLRDAAAVEERCEEVERGLPVASPGHVWTVSSVNFKQVYDIYNGCLSESGAEN